MSWNFRQNTIPFQNTPATANAMVVCEEVQSRSIPPRKNRADAMAASTGRIENGDIP